MLPTMGYGIGAIPTFGYGFPIVTPPVTHAPFSAGGGGIRYRRKVLLIKPITIAKPLLKEEEERVINLRVISLIEARRRLEERLSQMEELYSNILKTINSLKAEDTEEVRKLRQKLVAVERELKQLRAEHELMMNRIRIIVLAMCAILIIMAIIYLSYKRLGLRKRLR